MQRINQQGATTPPGARLNPRPYYPLQGKPIERIKEVYSRHESVVAAFAFFDLRLGYPYDIQLWGKGPNDKTSVVHTTSIALLYPNGGMAIAHAPKPLLALTSSPKFLDRGALIPPNELLREISEGGEYFPSEVVKMYNHRIGNLPDTKNNPILFALAFWSQNRLDEIVELSWEKIARQREMYSQRRSDYQPFMEMDVPIASEKPEVRAWSFHGTDNGCNFGCNLRLDSDTGKIIAVSNSAQLFRARDYTTFINPTTLRHNEVHLREISEEGATVSIPVPYGAAQELMHDKLQTIP
jgi:hypothetical protein